MASSGLELLWVSLPQLAKGAGQTLSISFLSIAISTVGGVFYGVLRTLNVGWLNANFARVPGAVPGDSGAGLAVPAVLRPADFLRFEPAELLVRGAGAVAVGRQRGRRSGARCVAFVTTRPA